MSQKVKFYVLLSHDLLPVQQNYIKELDMEIIYLPSELKKLWSEIDMPLLEYIKPILEHLTEVLRPIDNVLIQGHAGATYLVVNKVKELGATALYAHSPRNNKEEQMLSEDTSESRKSFQHKLFMEYGV